MGLFLALVTYQAPAAGAVDETPKDRGWTWDFWLCCCITCTRMGKLLHLLCLRSSPCASCELSPSLFTGVFITSLCFVFIVVLATKYCDTDQTLKKQTRFGKTLKAVPHTPRTEHKDAAAPSERRTGPVPRRDAAALAALFETQGCFARAVAANAAPGPHIVSCTI